MAVAGAGRLLSNREAGGSVAPPTPAAGWHQADTAARKADDSQYMHRGRIKCPSLQTSKTKFCWFCAVSRPEVGPAVLLSGPPPGPATAPGIFNEIIVNNLSSTGRIARCHCSRTFCRISRRSIQNLVSFQLFNWRFQDVYFACERIKIHR